MFCPQCGTKNDDDAVFCSNCGADVSQAFSEAQASQPQQSDAGFSPPVQDSHTAAPTYVYQSGTAAVKPGTPMKTSTKITMAIIVVLIVACAALYNVAKQMNSPEKCAQTYFGAIQAKDWAKAYPFLDVTESDFINEANFAKMMEKSVGAQKIVNYSILDEKTLKSGTSNGTDDQMKDPLLAGGLTKVITVQYTVQGETEPQTVPVILVKQPQKNFFLFDTWKVSPGGYITPEADITVPYGTTAYLDGVKIPDSAKAEDVSSGDSSSDSSGSPNDQNNQPVSYQIKNIFAGTHVLKVTSPYTDDYTENVTADGDRLNAQVGGLQVKKSILDQVSQQAQQTIQDIYASAVAGKGFDSIKNSFISDSNVQSYLSENYDRLLDQIAAGDHSDNGFKSISVSDFNTQVLDSGENSGLFIKLTTDFNYAYTAVSPNYMDSTMPPQQQSYTDKGEISFTYTLIDGKWLIEDATGLALYRNYY